MIKSILVLGSLSTLAMRAGEEPQAGPAVVEINEIVRTAGSGFVELYDGGLGATSLDGLVLVLYEGATDSATGAFDLDGFSTDSAGYFVLGQAGVANADLLTSEAIPEAVVLYTGDAIDFPSGTPVVFSAIVDAFTTTLDAGLAPLVTSGTTYRLATQPSTGRCPDGAGGSRDISRYTFAEPTPGAPSNCIDGISFCNVFDGADAVCPCTIGTPDSGCDRPIAPMHGGGTTGGVRLRLFAQMRGASNRATLVSHGHPTLATPSTLTFRSPSLVPGGARVFGDGVLCVGSPVTRIGGAGAVGGVGYHTFGHSAMSGLFYYQTWVRSNPISFCDPTAPFVVTNGIKLTW